MDTIIITDEVYVTQLIGDRIDEHDLIYISGKYSHKNPCMTDVFIAMAEMVGVAFREAGFSVFIPHKNSAHGERHTNIGYEDWMREDIIVLDRCSAICMLPMWPESPGAKKELSHVIDNPSFKFLVSDITAPPLVLNSSFDLERCKE